MTKIQLRRDTAANWSTNNPTPSAGEPCFETDTGKLKIGDGITAYNSLPYQGGSNDAELNNPYSLFDIKYSDHELNNLSWLKSEGQWNAKAVYPDAYDELLAEYNNAESVEETEGTVIFKRTPKGYKIALSTQETAILNKYNTDGIAWYYILDTTNTQFKLPRTKYGFEGLRTNVGDKIDESLPNITGNAAGNSTATEWNYSDNMESRFKGALYVVSKNNSGIVNTGSNATKYTLGFDASRSSSTYKDGAPVQERATQMYLYFYVGETVQNANLIDAGRIGEVLATKTDMLQATKASMPSDRYIDLTLGASGTTYTAPADGWFCFNGKDTNTTGSAEFVMRNQTRYFGVAGTKNQVLPPGWSSYILPAKRGDIIRYYYEGTIPFNNTNWSFRFYYAEGSQPST